MQPHKLIRYAAITLVLFYFSTSHGFLDACPKRHSVTDKCYQEDDKYRDYRRSERRIADVLQRNEDLDKDTPRTDTGDGRMLDRNNNRITPQRDRFTSKDDHSTRFRSFSTISRRSDRMNNQRRNAGNSMQKPTLKARVFDDNVRRANVGNTEERRLSQTHETEARRSRQPNSNEFSNVFREQRRIREAEERIWNLERRNTRQEKNKEDTSRSRQTDRVLADHRTSKDDNRRSSIRDSDDRRHSPARSISRFGREEQISPARNNRQTDRVLDERRRNVDNSRRSSVRNSDDRRRSPATRDYSPQSSRHLGSVLSDTRREAATSRSGREERTPLVRADRRSSTRREIALPSTSTFRRDRDARNRDTFRLLQLERIPADSGDRRSTRDYSQSGRKEQDSRLSSIRCEDASSRSGREDRTSFACADRSSSRREIALPNTSDASTFRRERDVKNRDTFRLRQLERIPADHRRNVDGSRRSLVQDSGDRRATRDYSEREEQNSRLSSMRRDDASSRSGREERTSHGDSSTRRESAPPRASIDSFTFRREERSLAARDSRQSSIHRQLSLPDVRRNVVYSRSTRQEPDGFGRKLLATDARRNTISSSSWQERRESRQLANRQLASFPSAGREDMSSIRDDRPSSVRRERALSNSRLDATSARLEERSSIVRDNRQILTPSDVRREARRISAARDGSQSSTRREHNLSNSRRNVESSWYRQKERGNQQILTRRISPAGVHRDATSPGITRDDRRSSIRRELVLFNTFGREERPSLVHHERRLASANTLFRRESAFDRRESTHREHALLNTRRDAASSRFREEPSRIHREDRRQSSAMMQTERRSVANHHRELAEFDDRKQTSVRSHSSSRADRRQSSIRRGLTGDGDRIRRSRSISTSRTDEQRLINRRLLEVSVGRRDVNSRRLLDEELHSSASFSEHVKSEARDNFGYKLTSRIAKDWSNLANTLLIALTLFQILAKTYPKKVGYRNLLHNSLGCVKQKVQ